MTNIVTHSSYAPKPAADPLMIGKITIEAVDHIGSKAAAEIEQTAGQIRIAADDVARRLEQLAEAIRDHSRIASEHTAGFVNRTTQVLETIRSLEAKLAGNGQNGASHVADQKEE